MRTLTTYLSALLARGGPFVGDDAPSTRVTVIPNWFLNPTGGQVGNYPANKLPIRSFSVFATGTPGFSLSAEIELYGIKSVSIDRTLDQDAATMTMTQYNQQMDPDTLPGTIGSQLGEPGYFSWTRGQSSESASRWGQFPNEWRKVLGPNAMLKVYQGYGGKDIPLQNAFANGNVMLTGVFLIDTVTLDANGTATYACRDMAKLLIEQMVYPPLIPVTVYPLEYYLDNQGPGGSPDAPVGSGLPGNYSDYYEIVRDLLLWSGWFAYDGNILISELPPQVFGNLTPTGVNDTAGMITYDVFDKKPVIDVIKLVRDIVGFIFYIDEVGAAHFEIPNWWSSGNFSQDVGIRTAEIPVIDERVNLSGYAMAASDASLRSQIIVTVNDPNDQAANTNPTAVYVPPDISVLRGMQRVLMTGVPTQVTAEQQTIMAELIALQIAFSQRAGQVTAVFNPAITLDTQIQIYERVTGETYSHYVKAVHTDHDMDTGKLTMTLVTNWLGTQGPGWAIGTGMGSVYQITNELAVFLGNINSPKTGVYKGTVPIGGTKPGAPGRVSASPNPESATVTWNASTGGGTPTSYRVTPYTAGAVSAGAVTVPSTATSALVTGLIDGHSYYFVVGAVDTAGTTYSTPSNTIVPAADSPPPSGGGTPPPPVSTTFDDEFSLVTSGSGGSGTLFGWQLTPSNTGLPGVSIDKTTLPTWSGGAIPANTTVNNMHFPVGTFDAQAGNITVNRCWIEGNDRVVQHDPTGSLVVLAGPVIIQDCDIQGHITDISGSETYPFSMLDGAPKVTLTRCLCYGWGEGVYGDSAFLVDQCYWYQYVSYGTDLTGNHVDGMTRRGGGQVAGAAGNFTIKNSYIDTSVAPPSGDITGDIFLQNFAGPLGNMTLDGCYFNNANLEVIFDDSRGGGANTGNLIVNNCRFATGGTQYGYNGGNVGWTTWTNNYENNPSAPPNNQGAAITSAP